jgi:hypothetical protein
MEDRKARRGEVGLQTWYILALMVYFSVNLNGCEGFHGVSRHLSTSCSQTSCNRPGSLPSNSYFALYDKKANKAKAKLKKKKGDRALPGAMEIPFGGRPVKAAAAMTKKDKEEAASVATASGLASPNVFEEDNFVVMEVDFADDDFDEEGEDDNVFYMDDDPDIPDEFEGRGALEAYPTGEDGDSAVTTRPVGSAGSAGSAQSQSQNDKEWMFFDTARVNVKGGDGGAGCMAMRREAYVDMGGPCGGNGGDGGDVYLECDPGLNTLSLLRRRVHHRADSGTNGMGKSMHGRRGESVIIPVPPGTVVRDANHKLVGELNNPKQRLRVAKGGRGGRGNEAFKTARRSAPSFAEKGEVTDPRWINVELKLLADVGLVGLPNAGKSTLLAAVTNANPKVSR